ncbi:MAG: hypothetical protein KKD77_22065, partial [Gammaproteobacteria bacterium]|nr:hypothetical protein [Gammaproteobacteria bacterium]
NSGMPSEAKYGEVFKAIAKEQAEISFKAGIREVVEWVERHHEETNHWYDISGASRKNMETALVLYHKKAWESKLKEWGIEE